MSGRSCDCVERARALLASADDMRRRHLDPVAVFHFVLLTCVRHYKSGDYDEAADYYSMALEYCPEDEEHKQDRAVYLGNRAACHLQLKEVRLKYCICRTARDLASLLTVAYVKPRMYIWATPDNLPGLDTSSSFTSHSSPRVGMR